MRRAGRHDLFHENQDRKSGDPQHVHGAASKEKRHKHPAAPDAIQAVLGAEA